MNSECVEDGMGKALLRTGDKVAEIDLDDSYGRDLVREFLGLTVVAKRVESASKPRSETIGKSVRGKHFDLSQEELISHTIAESTARKNDPGSYDIYRNRQTGRITGVLKTSKHTLRVDLGNPDDPNSKISQIRRVGLSMPYYEVFNRRQLSRSLPTGISKSGEVMKFALDYLEAIGLIVKLKDKDRSSNAFVYKRINEKRDAPAAQSVEDGAKAIPR